MFPHTTRLYGIIQPGLRLRLPCTISSHPPFPGRIGSQGQARPGHARITATHVSRFAANETAASLLSLLLLALLPLAAVCCCPIACACPSLMLLLVLAAVALRPTEAYICDILDAVMQYCAVLLLVPRCFRLSEDKDALSGMRRPPSRVSGKNTSLLSLRSRQESSTSAMEHTHQQHNAQQSSTTVSKEPRSAHVKE